MPRLDGRSTVTAGQSGIIRAELRANIGNNVTPGDDVRGADLSSFGPTLAQWSGGMPQSHGHGLALAPSATFSQRLR
jgi:hypothetical protein